MYMIVERQYMDVKNILYLHKYLCRFSFKIRKEKKSLMVWEAALLASKAKHYCCEAVLKPKKSTKCFTGKNDFMDLCRNPYHQYWNEIWCPLEDSSWYAQPIQPNLADISACVPPALKKGIMFYFKFGKFSFYKGP